MLNFNRLSPIFGLSAAAASLSDRDLAAGRKPVILRDVLGPDKARREARRQRAKRRTPRAARGSHLAQLGAFGHKDRRPSTYERMRSRCKRCKDCHSTGVRTTIELAPTGKPGVYKWERQPSACGCVRP